MPSIRDPLGHQFTVNPVTKSIEVDTFTNIIKRREEILYRTVVPPQATNVAYVATEEVSSDNNLSIADRSTSLAANRVREANLTIVSSVSSFTIDTENFIITDIFTTPSQTVVEVPLFYKHVLSTENVPRDTDGDLDGVELLKVQLLDSLLEPIGTPEQSIDYTAGIIYNNLESDYTSSSDYTIYYVKYVIRDGNEIKTFVDLLNNIPVYNLATFDDLTVTLVLKTDGRKVYMIEEVAGGFEVTLPIESTYAYKPTSSARIRVIHPPSASITDPWYVRVTNGKFFSEIASVLYKYHIAEFLTQNFTPSSPIKQSSLEESTILSDSLIKLDHENIYQGTDYDLYVNILIDDEDNEAVAAYTTNSSLIGTTATNGTTYQKWDNLNRTGIRSIDHSTGILQIEGTKLKSSYVITSSYFFEEENYEITTLNFNPIGNDAILSQRIVLFIDPDTTATAKTQTLHYLKVNESGKVIESDWDVFDNTTMKHLDGEAIYYERFPEFLQTTTSGEINYLSPDTHVFIDEFSTEASGVLLVLGDITVNESVSAADAETFDTRKRGGGIIESEIETLRETYPEVGWHWDIGTWDGVPYPGNASYMVEVPVTIMDGAGGQFTAEEVRSIVEKHTAFGIYPVVRAYGVDIEYTDIQIDDGITIKWRGRNAGDYTELSTNDALGHTFEVNIP